MDFFARLLNSTANPAALIVTAGSNSRECAKQGILHERDVETGDLEMRRSRCSSLPADCEQGDEMAKFTVILHNRLPCNLNPVVLGFHVQLGHQDSSGNIIDVEKLASAPNTPCNQSTQLVSGRETSNVGVVSIICKVNIGGQDKLMAGRTDTSTPGTSLPNPFPAELAYDFDYVMTRDDTDPDAIMATRTHGGKIRFPGC